MLNNMINITGKTEIFLHNPDGTLAEHEVKHNLIGNDLKYTIAKHLGNGTVDFGIDSLFTTNDTQAGAGENGNDGIVLSDGTTPTTMITTKDSAGTGSENYIVFKGVYTATGTYTVTNLFLGRNLDWPSSTTPFSEEFATQTTSKAMTNGQVLTVLWTVTFS